MITPEALAHRQHVAKLEKQVREAKNEFYDALRNAPPFVVNDYTFKSAKGTPIQLSSLFGDASELLIVHNMGRLCPYCTLWADGFIGITHHLANRVPFVVVTPDEPTVMSEFANSRGWNFRVASSHGSSFKRDVGFEDENGVMPGVSSFRKRPDGVIEHVASTWFGPGDDFAPIWFFLELLPSHNIDWSPQIKY